MKNLEETFRRLGVLLDGPIMAATHEALEEQRRLCSIAAMKAAMSDPFIAAAVESACLKAK